MTHDVDRGVLVNSWACLFNAFQSIHIHIVTTFTVYRKYCLYVAIMPSLRILIVINCYGYLMIGLCNGNQSIGTPCAPQCSGISTFCVV